MTCVELVIVILTIGLVSMIEVLAIMAGVSKMIDAKAKSRIEITNTVFRNEMEYIDKILDKYFGRIEKMIESAMNKGGTPEQNKIGFGG